MYLQADYFCAQTYHFQQRKIEDNELAKNTAGQMRRMFGRLGKLIVDADLLASSGVAAVAAAGAGAAPANTSKPVRVKTEPQSTQLDSDLIDEEDLGPRKLPDNEKEEEASASSVVTGKRRAAAQAEAAIRQALAKEKVIDVDGDVDMGDDDDDDDGDKAAAGAASESNGDVRGADESGGPQEEEEEDGEEYEVEDLLDDRVVDGRRQFLVRWKGYDESYDTWQDTDDCANCPDIVKAYVQRRYHAFPDKLLSMLSSFKRARPAGEAAAAPSNMPNLLNLPADVRFFHDIKNNMIVLQRSSFPTAAVQQVGRGHIWKVAFAEPPARDSAKRAKNHAPPDPVGEGMDVMGLWNNQQRPAWLEKISFVRSLDVNSARRALTELHARDPRNLLGCWSKEHAFKPSMKVWFSAMGWAIIERSAGSVETLLQLHPNLLHEPCFGDVGDELGATSVDPMCLAAWHARVEIVELLLRAGGSPFSTSKWSGIEMVLPFEMALVWYYKHHGGLINECLCKVDNPPAILAAMRDSIGADPCLDTNPLYCPVLSPQDSSSQAKVLSLFLDWRRAQPDLVRATEQAMAAAAAVKQTARRSGRLGPGAARDTSARRPPPPPGPGASSREESSRPSQHRAASAAASGGGGSRHSSKARSPERPSASRARSPERRSVSRARSPERRSVSRARSPERRSVSRTRSPERRSFAANETFGMDPLVANAMDKVQLGMYVRTLAEHGICTLGSLRAASDQDFRDLGLKPFHITKLTNLAAELVIEKSRQVDDRKRKL